SLRRACHRLGFRAALGRARGKRQGARCLLGRDHAAHRGAALETGADGGLDPALHRVPALAQPVDPALFEPERGHAGGHLRPVRDGRLSRLERLRAGTDGAHDDRRRRSAGARPHRSFSRARGMSAAPDVADMLAELMRRYRDAGTAADSVYAALRHGIVEGLLPPGTKLRADELAKQLGISRTPIREAHLKLEAEGLIVVRPGVGLVVQAFSPEEVIEIYHIREMLEGKAAALAAENANAYERAGLAELMSEITVATDVQDFALLRRLTGAFHLTICR